MNNSSPAEFSVSKAHYAQRCMAQKIIAEDCLPEKVRLVAGVDAAYTGELAFGAVAVLDYDSLDLLETQTAVQPVKFPYVSGLLSFRELPVVMACIRKLKLKPDVFLVDGHGRAHPFECGFASHLGLVLGNPTVGVAKSRLVGEPQRRGEEIFLVKDGEVVGAEVTTLEGVKPVYVSVGHMVSLETAIQIVKHVTQNSRIPKPILQAHRLASEKRKAHLPR